LFEAIAFSGLRDTRVRQLYGEMRFSEENTEPLQSNDRQSIVHHADFYCRIVNFAHLI
jgi:hypothetical protein